MTIVIADNSPRKSYTATAGQTAFPTVFAFFDEADINVYINDTLQTLTTNYTVTGGSGSDGTVTLTTGASAGDVIVLTRDVELERTTDFPSSGPFQVGSLNTELDKIIAMIADMKDLAERGLRLADSDTGAALQLEDKNARKGTVLAFNATTGAVEVGPTIADTQSIADIKADIAALADIEDGTVATDAISNLAAITSDVTTVAGVTSNVTTVAGQTTNMQNVTDNLSAIQNAATNATTASTKATEAATSATNAATSATNAATSATAASTAQTAAETAQTAAETAQTAAETAETNAETAQTAAETAQTAAETAETNAAASATTATTKASEASTSATNAATSETNASGSATNAASSATAAQTAKDAALAALDSFDDRYLGVKTANPTVDNDGNALVAGAIYFNSTDGAMKVYTGSAWVAAYVDGSDYAALVGATFTGSVTMPTVDINGGAIDGTTIGGSTAAAGTFTTLQASGNVGLGETSPTKKLVLSENDSECVMIIKSSDTGSAGIYLGDQSDEIRGGLIFDNSTDKLYLRASDNQTAMTIDSSERVSIGTTSTGSKFHVHTGSSGESYMQITNSTTGTSSSDGLTIGLNSSEQAIFWQRENNDIRFGTNNTTRMTIDSSGNVGIGTTSPSTPLHISATSPTLWLQGGASGQSNINLGPSTDGDEGGIFYNQSSNALGFRAGAAERMRITSDGSVGIGTTSAYGTNVLNVNGGIAIDGRNASTPGLCEKGDTNTGIFWPAADTLAVTTNGTERMRIDSSGRVGIGLTNPTGLLHLKGDTPSGDGGSIYLQVNNNNSTDRTGIIRFGNNVTTTTAAISGETVGGNQNGEIRFFTRNGSVVEEAFRINSDQELIAQRRSASDGYPFLKIRQGSSQHLPTMSGGRSEGSFVLGLGVEAGIGSSTYNFGTGSSSVVMKSTYSSNYGKMALSIGHQDFQFYGATSNSATPVGQNVTLQRAFRVQRNGNITASGTVTGNGAYINSSDERLKENIENYGTASTKINGLRVVNFDWINADQAANQGRQTGFLAQEVQDVAPELVVDTDIDSDEDYLGINVTSLLAVTVKALQEANSKIETLETKVSALETKVAALEAAD